MKIAVLFHRLGPYQRARLQSLAGSHDVVGIEVVATSPFYPWAPVTELQFEHRSLLPQTDGPGQEASAVIGALRELDPGTVFIAGYSRHFALAALEWAVARGRRAVLMSDSSRLNSSDNWAKRMIKRRVVDCYDAALVAGTPQKKYLEDLGMPRKRISMGYDVVDNEWFGRKAHQVRTDPARWRASLGLPERYFVTPARMIPQKNLALLLRGYRSFRAAGQSAKRYALVILGDGPSRPVLESLVTELGLEHDVFLPGFVPHDKMPPYYALSEALILPSLSETWGLVVNEAMACQLPVIVSNRCGCVQDLVEDGGNGFTFDPTDPNALAIAMLRITSGDRADMGQRSWEIISDWSINRFRQGFEESLENASSNDRSRGSKVHAIIPRMLRMFPETVRGGTLSPG